MILLKGEPLGGKGALSPLTVSLLDEPETPFNPWYYNHVCKHITLLVAFSLARAWNLLAVRTVPWQTSLLSLIFPLAQE